MRDEASPEQIVIFRAMTGEQRLQIAEQLFWTARAEEAAAIRDRHPEWPEELVDAEVTRIFLNAGT